MRTEITLVFLCLLSVFPFGSFEGFQLLVFGGFKSERSVQLFPSLTEDFVCQLTSLPQYAEYKPYAGFMKHNLTICVGGLSHCYYAKEQSEELTWSQSYQLDVEFSSLVTTFDGNDWAFFGGSGSFYNFYTWSLGLEGFQKHEQNYLFASGLCSTRKNQTHAIISGGSKNTYWYREIGMDIMKWEDGPTDGNHAGCGLAFHSERGYEFVSAGGVLMSETLDSRASDLTEVYNFDQDIWLEGPPLPKNIRLAASVPYQNGFILVGGCDDFVDHDTMYLFDSNYGWIELPIKLGSPYVNVGAIRIPKEKLQCP